MFWPLRRRNCMFWPLQAVSLIRILFQIGYFNQAEGSSLVRISFVWNPSILTRCGGQGWPWTAFGVRKTLFGVRRSVRMLERVQIWTLFVSERVRGLVRVRARSCSHSCDFPVFVFALVFGEELQIMFVFVFGLLFVFVFVFAAWRRSTETPCQRSSFEVVFKLAWGCSKLL